MYESSEYYHYIHYVIFNKNFIYSLLNFRKNIYYVIHHLTKIYLHIWKNNQSKYK